MCLLKLDLYTKIQFVGEEKNQPILLCVIRKLFDLQNDFIAGNFSFCLLFIGMTFKLPVVKYFVCPTVRENWSDKKTLNVTVEKCNKPKHCTNIHEPARAYLNSMFA